MSHASRPPEAETLSRIRLRGLLDQLFGEGLAVELRVTGQSMSPFIRGGDLATLVPLKGRAARRGDVVAFRSGGQWLVIHRVVEIQGEKVRTRGDGLRRGDEAIQATDVMALVTAVKRGGRRHRLGFRREGVVIAWLSDHGWLVPLLAPPRFVMKGLRGLGKN